MNEAFLAILYQALGYFTAFIICFLVIAVLMRGFFLKYLRVRASLGRLIMIKIREVNTWTYDIGKIEEGNLIFGKRDKKKMLSGVQSDMFYRSLGITWINLDGATWAVMTPELQGVQTHDPEKVESLYIRALYKPAIRDNKELLMIILLIVGVGLIGFNVYMTYKLSAAVGGLGTEIRALKEMLKVPVGLVVPTP